MRAGEVYENRIQGDRVVVREGSQDTGGERLVVDLCVRPGGAVAAKHVHSYITERFEVLAGTVRFHLNGRDEVTGPGRPVEVTPGSVHTGGTSAMTKRTCSSTSDQRSASSS